MLTATGPLAQINPFRYRGYYFDAETGFYYLQSRYYDPSIGRFISADKYASTSQGIIGNNMFAYCNNNPIIAADYDGEWLNIVIGAVVGGAINFISAKVQGKSTEEAIVSAACGAFSGAMAGMGLGALGGAVSGLIDSGFSNYRAVKAGEKSIGEAVLGTVVDTAVSTAFGAIGSSNKAAQKASNSISNAAARGLTTVAKRKLFNKAIHPVVYAGAKRAIRIAGKYAWNAVKSNVSDGAISSAVSWGVGKVTNLVC